jgi:hypothetical protein
MGANTSLSYLVVNLAVPRNLPRYSQQRGSKASMRSAALKAKRLLSDEIRVPEPSEGMPTQNWQIIARMEPSPTQMNQ